MTRPYFYIIKEILSGKQYAGSRWRDGCSPDELLTPTGYKTSSNIINKLLLENGLDSFQIIEVLEMSDPYKYETKFLIENDCAGSDLWFNLHNNEDRPPPYGSEKFINIMLNKYGVTHNTQIPEVLERMKLGCKKFYKENPEFGHNKAIKVAEIKKKNGTTGLGVARLNYTNNGSTGNWERTDEQNKQWSEYQKEHSIFITNNPMDDPEKRKLVSLSKIGRKRVYREDGSYYMSKVKE